MTSLSNVIKRQRATTNEPLRIESKSLLKPVLEQSPTLDHEQTIQARYAELERAEEAFRQYQEQEMKQLAETKSQTLDLARQEGYEAGFIQGKSEGRAEFEEVTTRLNSVSVELEQWYEEKWRKSEQDLVKLAVSISEQVTTELVRNEDALFADMIRRQLTHHADAESLMIFVHPTRLASIQRFESEWVTPDTPPLKYRGDASVSETSVRIESPHKGAEIDLAYSFERIQSKIEEVLSDGAY